MQWPDISRLRAYFCCATFCLAFGRLRSNAAWRLLPNLDFPLEFPISISQLLFPHPEEERNKWQRTKAWK
jgi:hypothetical protein